MKHTMMSNLNISQYFLITPDNNVILWSSFWPSQWIAVAAVDPAAHYSVSRLMYDMTSTVG